MFYSDIKTWDKLTTKTKFKFQDVVREVEAYQYYNEELGFMVYIHGEAVVDDTANLGNRVIIQGMLGANTIIDDGTFIGEGVIIPDGSYIGKGCAIEGVIAGKVNIGDTTIVHKDSSVGVDCEIGNCVGLGFETLVGDGAIIKDYNKFGVKCHIAPGIEINECNSCGMNVTINSSVGKENFIGTNVLVGAPVGDNNHIDNDCEINAPIGSGNKISQNVIVNKRIGDINYIHAQAIINADVGNDCSIQYGEIVNNNLADGSNRD